MKSGKVGVGFVRDLRGVVERENAEMGRGTISISERGPSAPAEEFSLERLEVLRTRCLRLAG